jgi:hypothetical protein
MERRGQSPPEGVLWDCYGKWDNAGEDFFENGPKPVNWRGRGLHIEGITYLF